ncbi:MAG TPA: A/G-specific adenine glycosylase [Ornithinibacter sp.]|nr:A/G-specific adenine glycosylase [Ornithinibacter sp.]
MRARLTARQAGVLSWWEGQRRDLPWRQTRDPWEVLVCEVMAQQTQVARVAERWRPFIDRFPTPAALAAVPSAEVVRWWSGLGYNRRALALHRTAQAVVRDHGGRLPADLAALQGLPGIGPYTARAVLAFAFEADHGVVDTNTARVLARWAGRRLRATEAQAAADSAVPAGAAWAWNQAMLDLGARVCRRRAPRCEDCPVTAHCGWTAAGLPSPDPAEGSAGVPAAQPPFEGSDRQGRGRLVEALRGGPVAAGALAGTMGWPGDPARAERVAATLLADGLVARADDGTYVLSS